MLAGVVLALALASAPAPAPRSAEPDRIALELVLFRLVNAPRIVEAIGRFLIVLSRGPDSGGDPRPAR
ncbi:hypothetical protein SAMN04489726_0246 [Allokutzneria albata]|uniref:Uncharacterized protein n=1 Tax=Allokutzneria albata TaxID=211114 RepID=A0A1G9R5W6_ALLAB|nr:hypothetical protein SAMN04489726_0246 [Allokutzneria albata]